MAVQREALWRSKGVCECHLIPHVFSTRCGRPLGVGDTFYEHIVCDQITKDNSLENCAVLTRTCWRLKTASYDLPTIAKAKRNFDRHYGITDPWRKCLPGGRHDELKKKMNGAVVARSPR